MHSIIQKLIKIAGLVGFIIPFSLITAVNGSESWNAETKRLGLNPIAQITKQMRIKKEASWNLPAGFHRAKISNAVIANQGTKEEELRLIFELVSLVHPLKTYVAKRTYRASDPKVADDLQTLLGPRVIQVVNLQGEIIPQGLELLKGIEVDIQVEHIQGRDHENPFCLVTELGRAGSLIEELREVA